MSIKVFLFCQNAKDPIQVKSWMEFAKQFNAEMLHTTTSTAWYGIPCQANKKLSSAEIACVCAYTKNENENGRKKKIKKEIETNSMVEIDYK